MTRLVRILPLAFVLGCASEEGIVAKALPPGEPVPVVREQVDVIVQPPFDQVDVLWVIDNSCSMSDDQQALAAHFDEFIDWFQAADLDFHLGVVTTDPARDHGVLRHVAGRAWIDADTVDPLSAFRQLATVGTLGTQAEAGLWSTWLALDVRADFDNTGFLRPSASVHTVVISDEDDHTPEEELSLDEFVGWYRGMREQRDRRTFSAIVRANDPRASRYLAAVEQLDGATADIQSADWVDVLDDLGQRMSLPKVRFFLSRTPIDNQVEAELFEQGRPIDLIPGMDWEYDVEANAVRFLRGYPEPGAEVHVRYLSEFLD